MNSSTMEQLFRKIFSCNGEEELHSLVESNELLSNSVHWFPYGGKHEDDRSNFGTFENQQSHSGAALVEKITNSIDALLLKRCKQKGIDPKSRTAPQTMEDATERFFDIPKGDIGELPSSKRTSLAKENLQIIATGNNNKPDLIVFDNGEGQHLDNFASTFLSIANNNKTDINFVQGKYNMGSTGAVVFCGEYRYQLIASKQDETIFNTEKKYPKNLFGWTLVRRHELTEEENQKYGSSWYEYFAIDGKKIPQFSIENLDIGLANDKKFTTGTFIKLFSYEMPKGAKGAIYTDLNRELNQLLYKPALPLWLYENRTQYKSNKKKSIAVYGNHIRITSNEESDDETASKDILEHAPIYESFSNTDMGEVTIYAVVFKKGINPQQHADRKRNFIGTGRNVIYTLNGQTQGMEGQSFVTQDLKFNFLKDSLLIVIDCSKIHTQYRQDLFMANRSNMRDSDKRTDLRNKVIDILRGNETLRRINNERKNSLLQGGDDKKEKELIESILSHVPLDSTLTNLLKKGLDAVNLPRREPRSGQKNTEKKTPKETKRFPSVFKININEDDKTGKKIKSIPLNGKGVIQFETDVAEDYFYRSHDKGNFEIHVLGGENNNNSEGGTEQGKPSKVEDVFLVNKSGPTDSSIKLTLQPKNNLSVGAEVKLNARLTSPDGDLDAIFYVKIANPQKEEKKPVANQPEKPNLPQIIKVIKRADGWYKDKSDEEADYSKWDEVVEWNEESVIHVISSYEEEQQTVSAIAINMDSYVLSRYLSKSQAKGEKQIEFFKQQYISKIYLHGLFLYSILNKLYSSEDNKKVNNESASAEELVAKIFKKYGDVLMYLDVTKEIADAIDDY